MIFLVLTDDAGPGGVQAVQASGLSDAADQIRQLVAAAGSEFAAPAQIGVVLPQFTATIEPGDPPTVTFSGDQDTQRTLRNAAQTALTNNQTFLAVSNPTNAQIVAQVKAVTRQVDGLIRFLVADFSGTN